MRENLEEMIEMTKTKEVMITDRFIFHKREDLVQLLELLEVIKYERMYMVKAKGVWGVMVTYPWLVEEEV